MGRTEMTIIKNVNLLGLIALLSILVLSGCETTKSKGCPYSNSHISETQQKAETGDPIAQYIVAVWHQHGGCLPKDISKAIDSFQRAADQGFTSAEYQLATIYFYGDGIPEDIDQGCLYKC